MIAKADVLAQSITDTDILNFALNLEYLEGEFYSVATSGKRLSELGIGVTGRGRAGDTTGGSKVSLDDRIGTIAASIAADEQAHVTFLRTALRSDAVAKPANSILSVWACTPLCTAAFCNPFPHTSFMKADFRISVKDNRGS